MAILKISKQLLEFEPAALEAVKKYFDKFEYLYDEHSDIKVYTVEKEGLPKDDTQIECIMRRDYRSGRVCVYDCEII